MPSSNAGGTCNTQDLLIPNTYRLIRSHMTWYVEGQPPNLACGVVRTPTPQVASQPDEASAALLLCSIDDLTAASPAAACAPCADPHPATSATMHRRQKRLRTAQATATLQVTEPGQQPSVRHTQRSHSKRKAITQQDLQPGKRSTRQRFCPRVFDPSDRTAIAGYVQQRRVSPDMQSSLPFPTG